MQLPPGVTAADASEVPDGFTADPSQAAQAQQVEAQKASVLKQILTPAALERLGRVKLVKKAKAEALERKLIESAMRGELQRQLTEEALINMLETAPEKKVVVQRRKFEDSDDENDDDLW